MSDLTATLIPDTPSRTAPKSFLQHARLIGFLTLISRFFGLARDVVSAHFLGAKLVAAAFTFAFTVPNLFRKLFGEGALSAAFIPLYSQSLKNESAQDANDFAAATVNLLCAILVGVTIVSEAIVWGILLFCHGLREDWVLSLRLAGIMLPYVVLICGAAFIGGILQVHHRFGLPAAAPIILNACHIAVLIIGARLIGLNARAAVDEHKQTQLAYWLAMVVLVAGVMQISILLPALRHTGFRFKLSAHIWTPAIKKMLLLSLPVAMGAGVLQFSVVLDKGIAMALMQVHSSGAGGVQIVSNTFSIFGHSARLPMEEGAPTRLDRAQTLYQFPLGVFAIALATAIFPSLSADAMNKDRKKFRDALRHGIEASLWEGLPASVGLILVAQPIARLLFQHGQNTPHDADLIARSTAVYATAIWAFSLLQIINRAYYAVHDMLTPLKMAALNIVINLVVEIPLLWWLGESAMAVGTVVSFAVQALLMLWMLDRRIGGLGLRESFSPVLKMLIATAVMGIVCYGLKISPLYPHKTGQIAWAIQLGVLLSAGAAVYLGVCSLLGVTMMKDLLPRRSNIPDKTPCDNELS